MKKNDSTLNIVGLVQQVASNPLLSGLFALVINQGLYKVGYWDARPSSDGKTYDWVSNWGFSTDGGFHFDLGSREWRPVDPEQIASKNATIIGTSIVAGMLAFSASRSMVVPSGSPLALNVAK